MKKLLLLLFAGMMLTLVACGEGEDGADASTETDENSGEVTEASVETNEEKESEEIEVNGKVAPEDFDKMYSDPAAYQNQEVEFTGKVFIEPERDADGTYIQVYAKPENHEQNIIVGIEDSNLEVSMDDYVKVTGVVMDQFEGENLMGGTLAVPVVYASSVETVDYITAVSPTLKTIEVNEEINQHGFAVEVQKIELAENQTRVYVKVTNNTDDNVSLYEHSTYLILGNQQLETEYNYESDLPELQSEILPGVEAEGVLQFPAIDEATETFTFRADGSAYNYDLDIEPFIFNITAN
ncbi:DUF4352 domain-containing protein [Virgibacillus ainsalahensis]